LVKIEADQFLTSEPGGEEDRDHRAIAKGTAGGAERHGAITSCPALAAQLVEPFQPVAEVLQTAYLRLGQGTRFERR